MRLPVVLLVVLVILIATAAETAEVPVRIAAREPGGRVGGPSLVTTPSGYAVAWWSPAGNEPFAEYRFGRFDRDGAPLGDAVSVPGVGTFVYWRMRLEGREDGFLLLNHQGGATVEAVLLDRDGRPTGPVVIAASSVDILFDIEVAAAKTGLMLTYSEFVPIWSDYAQPVEDDGSPAGAPQRVRVSTLASALTPNVLPVAWNGRDGYVTVWLDPDFGVRLADLAGDGRPRRETITVADRAGCPSLPVVASRDGLDMVVYPAGCTGEDLWLRTRDRSGRLSGAVRLTDDPAPEGDRARSMVIADAPGRFAVVYRAFVPGTAFGSWRFAEFDVAGNPLGPVRDLEAEFGVTTSSGQELSLDYDSAADLWVVGWAGGGPEGDGIYFVTLE